jgi:hypothetical protein
MYHFPRTGLDLDQSTVPTRVKDLLELVWRLDVRLELLTGFSSANLEAPSSSKERGVK